MTEIITSIPTLLAYLAWFAIASVSISFGSWGLYTILIQHSPQVKASEHMVSTAILAGVLAVLSLIPFFVFDPILQGTLMFGLGGFLLCYSLFSILAFQLHPTSAT